MINKRNDLSKFIIHLTRDWENTDGIINDAQDNLIKILNTGIIKAINHHCIYTPILNKENIENQQFNVCCFSEIPIDKIEMLQGSPNSKGYRSSYGLIFLKDELMQHTLINDVININKENSQLKKMLNYMFVTYLKEGQPHDFPELGSLFTYVAKNQDYKWEREMRHRGDLNFLKANLLPFIIVAPEDSHKFIRENLIDIYKNIPIINSKSGFDNILIQMRNHFYNCM